MKGGCNGDQAKRLTTFHQRTGGKFHRQCARRSAVSGNRSVARQCRSGDLRARRAYGVAYSPLGQRLIVTAGCGWVQCWGGPKREIRPGDVVVCPPGEKHWHGATATTGISHIAIQEALDGKVVNWLEKVTDDEYLATPASE